MTIREAYILVRDRFAGEPPDLAFCFQGTVHDGDQDVDVVLDCRNEYAVTLAMLSRELPFADDMAGLWDCIAEGGRRLQDGEILPGVIPPVLEEVLREVADLRPVLT